jgi:hypothetical protein
MKHCRRKRHMPKGLVIIISIGTTALFEPWSSFKDSARSVIDHVVFTSLAFATVILSQSKVMSLAYTI